jgi:alkyldihydroxyacetonephosphate synthase
MTAQTKFDDLKRVVSPECLSFKPADLADHSYDWWPVAAKWRRQNKMPMSPELVASPRRQDEVSKILAWANAQGIAVTPWGAGSAVTGASLATQGGICLDLSAMNRTIQIDPINHLVRVEAGKMGHHLEEELNELGFTLNHSPQSLDRSTVGGWLSTRSSGQFSSRWGSIEDLCVSFSVVLANGEVLATPHTPRAAVGPDIRHFFIGAEGIAGVIVEVVLKIFPLAETRLLNSVRFLKLHQGLDAMRQFMQAGLRPFLVRYYDAEESPYAMQDEHFSDAVLFVGCEGLRRVAKSEMDAVLEICLQSGGEVIGPSPVESWMKRRFDFSAIERVLDTPGGIAETVEVAHFWGDIERTYGFMKKALQPLVDQVLGHFSHAYPQGTSLYLILLGQAADDQAAEQTLLEITDTAMRAALHCGAALSHHHGIGYVRRPHVGPYLGAGFELIRQLKDAVDPNGIMNPGKLV